MAGSVAKVASLEGQAWAKGPDGTLRPLHVGDTVTAEEIVITATGARIELDFGDGQPITIAGGQEVTMNRDLWTDLASDKQDAAVDDASVKEALTVLNNGGDLTQNLEETAAGLTGGGSNEGHDFVELTRVVEQTDPQAFNFAVNNPGTGGAPQTQATDPVNHAPVVANQSFNGTEDGILSGQIIADDTENDALTFSITTQPGNGTVALDPATGSFTYNPNANSNGPDSFVVTVTDDHGNATTTTINLNIAAVNDAPTSSDQSLTTAEDVAVNGQVVASDLEGDNLTFTISTASANGTVTIDAATGSFVYTPNANYNGPDQFVVTISDGNGGTTTSTITIGITPVNDGPVSSDQNLTTQEDTPVSGSVVATDVDGDTLSYALTTGVAHGTVTLDSASGAFVYTPAANYNGPDQFVVTISDGKGGTTTSTVNLGVIPVNDAPNAPAQNLTTAEDTPVSGNVGATDAEGDTLTYTLATSAGHGTVTLDANTGGFVYTPAANYNGPDSFTVTVDDGQGGTTAAIINIGVTPVNDAPVAANQSVSTPENVAVNGTVTATDADNDLLSYTLSGAPTNGSVTLNPATGGYVYTPNGGFSGSDSFSVLVSDGKGGTVTSVVTVGVIPAPNLAPVANNDTASTTANSAVTIAVRSNDSDADGDPLTVSGVTQGANGSVVIDGVTGNPKYTPNAGFTGSDSFTYTISDGNGGTATATVSVTVNPIPPANIAPVATNDSITTTQNSAINVAVRANDTDADGDALTVTGVTQGANGSVVIDGVTGNPIYTPNSGYTGNDSFTYTINDGNGHTATATVSVTVNPAAPVNNAPVANNDTAATNAGVAVTVAVRANDTDADGNPLTVTGVTQGANGSVVIDGVTGNPIYTPNAGFTGSDSFTYTISDGQGGTATATVNLTVNPVAPVNQAPVAVGDTINVSEGGTATLLAGGGTSVLANDTDANGDPLVAVLVTSPVNGSLTFNADGTFSYTHNGSETTTDSFTYKVNDGTVDGNTVTVNILVAPVNDTPVANNDIATTAQNTAVTIAVRGNDTDADGDPLTVSGVTQGANGTVVIDAVTGNPIYTPNTGFTGSDSFTYTVSDGNGGTSTATVNLSVIGNAPVAVGDSITVNEGGTATTLVGGVTSVLDNDSDADGDTLSAVLVTGPAHGSITLNSNGTFSYIHDGSETTTDSFTYKVNDGISDGNTVTVNIAVAPVNDAPVSLVDNISVIEGGTVTLLVGGATSVLANDSDAEGDVLSAVLVTGPAHGSLTLNPNGTFSYTHDGSETNSDSFTYRANDGTVNGNLVTVNIGVTPANDAPVSANQNLTTQEDTPLVGAVSATDAEGDTLSYAVTGNPTNGVVVVNPATGGFTYTPNANYNGGDSFTVTIDDGNGGTTTSTINIGVTPVNDAPISVADSISVNEGGTATLLVGGAASVLANDTDAESDPLTAVLVTGPAHGALTLNTDGTFSYTHDGSETTTDSFTYRANDGTANGNLITVNIAITPVNDTPVANSDSISVLEGGTTNILVGGATSLLSNDSDVDGDPLTAILVSGPANGTLSLNADGTFSYTHNGSQTTSDSFSYKVNDGTVDGNTVTVNIGVTPVNNAPVAVAETISVAEGGTATALVGGATSLLANDTDADGDPLTAALVTGPAHGSITLNLDGTFSYVHDGSETTTDSFSYKVNDGTLDGNTVTVNINVTPVNDAPVSVVDNISVAEGGTVSVLVGGATSVLANDTDADGDALSAVLVTGPSHGTLSLNANGTFSYIHDGSETTADSFTYRANDGTVNGNLVTVNIGITPANDAPVSSNQNLTTQEDTPLVGAVVATDAEGDTLSYAVTGNPANGVVVLNPATGGFTYTPNADYNGGDSFIVTIDDGNGGTTTSTINIGVTPVNDAPVSVSDSISVIEGGTVNVLVGGATSVLANDSDAEGDVLSAVLVTGPAHGSLTLNPNGTFSYTHDGSETTSDSFTYRANDGTVNGNLVTVNIGVTPANDAPVSANQNLTTQEDTPLVGAVSATDAEGDTLSYAVTGNPTNGVVVVNPATGGFTYTPNANYNGGDSFTVTIDDGNGGTTISTINIGVTPVNDAPISVADSISVNEGGTVSILVGGAGSVLANDTDADGDILSAILVASPAHGTLTLNPNGTFSYTHDGSETTSDSFSYKVNDGTVDGNIVTVNIGVTPQNDNPVAVDDNFTTGFNQAVTITPTNLLANDTDAEGDLLQVDTVSNVQHGSVSSVGGNLVFTPDSNYSGPASFTYQIIDGNGGVATATAHINVLPAAGGVNLSATSSLTEAGGNIVYTATLTNAQASDVTVTLANGEVILITAGQLTNSATTAVGANEDVYLDAGSIANSILSVSGGNPGLVVGTGNVSTTITDTIDVTTLSLTGAASITEGSSGSYTLSLTNPAQTAVTVTLNYSGVAANGTDISGTTTVTIAAGQPSATFNISALNDPLVEGAESFTVSIGGASGGNFESLVVSGSANSVTTTVVDTDTATATLSATSSLTEAGGNIVYTATLSQASSTATVLSLSNGQSITIAAGQLTGTTTVAVPANEDVYVDPTSISTSLTGVVSGNPGITVDSTPAVTNITDTVDVTTLSLTGAASITEGSSGSYTLSLTNPAQTAVTVTLNYSGVAANGTDISGTTTVTIAAGQPSATFNISALNDPLVEGAESFTVSIGGASGGNFENLVVSGSNNSVTTTVVDTDTATATLSATSSLTEAGGNIVYTATLSQASSTATVLSLSNGQTITIAAGQLTGTTTVAVPANEDVYVDPSSVSATLTGVVSGNPGITVDSTPAVTNITDTIDVTTLSLTGAASITEGSSGSYTLSLTNPAQTAVTVTLNYSGVAANGTDISGTTTVTIAAGQPSATFNISALNDPLVEGAESFTVSIGGTSGGNFESLVVSGSNNSVTTTVVDTDTATATLSATSSLTEAGGNIVYTATLSQASSTATVLSLSNGQTITIAAGQLTGTTTVAVPANEDVYVDPSSVSATLTGVVSGNPGITVDSTPAVTSITDTVDVTTLSLTGAASVTEGSSGSYTLSLTNSAQTAVTVTLNYSGVAANGTDISGTTTVTIPAGTNSANFNVAALNDPLVEGAESFTVSIGGTSGGNFENLVVSGSNNSVTTTVVDTDTATATLSATSSLTEAGGNIVYTATLSQASSTATVLSLSNGQSITIAAGQLTGTATVAVPANEDVYVDPSSVSATLTGVVSGNPGITVNSTPAVTSITDTVDVTTLSLTGAASIKEGLTGAYTLTLTNQAQTAVTVNLNYSGTAANGTDFTGVTSVTIPAGSSSVNFNIATLTDALTEGNESFTVSVGSVTGGNFESLVVSPTANSVTTSIVDNQAPDAIDDTQSGAASNLGLVSEYFGYREGTDGANLTSLSQIFAFINGRTPDATFTATTFDYGGTFGNNLGAGTNLQTFLGTDAASLSNDPGDTSDAIIHMRGFVKLNAGNYNFRILGDDGYQIKVDGVVVAESNKNQSPTTTVHTQFTVASNGIHSIEVVYWDQGGQANFKLELSNDSGTTYNLLSSVPTYKASGYSVVEDTPTSISKAALLANDTDPDNDALTIVSVQGATHGSVAMVGSNVIFTPDANYNGPASFTYTVSDGRGGTDTATVNLSVTPVNDAPVALNDTAKTNTGTALTIATATLTGNDSDLDGDAISITSVQNAVNGTVSLSGNNVIFTPTAGFEGNASFTYTIKDVEGLASTATVAVAVGTANAPSIVVERLLTSIAHGSGATNSVSMPIITSLVDTDGSESLSVKITGVPTGATLSAGTYDSSSSTWNLTTADLTNLNLNLPSSYSTGTNYATITVQVTSTEMYGGYTASTSSQIKLFGAYTTTDISTTTSGNYTGTSANEYITGGSGDNSISGGTGNDVIYGLGGNDTINGDNGLDILYGGAGNDTINGGNSSDRIYGGAGNDTLTGGSDGAVDVFVWTLGDQGTAGTPAVDTITDFGTAAAGTTVTSGGDVLDLRDLLSGDVVGASNGAGNLANYLHFEVSGGNTIIHVSDSGGFSADSHTVSGSYTTGAETQQIVLTGVNLSTLYSGATTDAAIITNLLNNNKLITD